MTALGKAVAGGAAGGKPVASRFMAALSGKRVLQPITVPVVELSAVMTILGAERSLDIQGDVNRAMAERGIAETVATQGKFELETAVRTLAEAVLESAENQVAFGTVKEWGQLPAEAISKVWFDYLSLRELHDPVGASVYVTDDDKAMIADAIVKKNGTLLLSCGVQKLTAYLLSTAAQPASSPTPKSQPGGESSES